MVHIFPYVSHIGQRAGLRLRPFSQFGQSVSTHSPLPLGRGGVLFIHLLCPLGGPARRLLAAACALTFMHFHPVMNLFIGLPHSGHDFAICVLLTPILACNSATPVVTHRGGPATRQMDERYSA